MSTRSSARRLLSPIEDPEKLISRRNQSEPPLLFNLEEDDMAGQAPPQGPIPDLRPMEELLQAPTDGVGDAIVVPPIVANQFELKIGLLNLVTAIAFHGFENDDPHSHICQFTKITQTVKLNNVPSDVVKLLLFPFSLEGASRTWLEKEPPNSIITWNDLVFKFIDTFYNSLSQSDHDSLNSAAGVASASGSSAQDAHISSLTKQTCGGPHPYYECQAADGYSQDVYATSGTNNQGGNTYQPQVLYERPPGAHPSNTEPNPREQVNSIKTRIGLTTAEPSIRPLVPPTPKVEVEKEPETLMDEVHITSPTSTAHVSPPEVQPVSPPKPKEDPKPNPHQPKIPYPSRLNKTKLLDKNDVQVSKFLKILKQIHFDIILMDALTQIPKFTKVLKDLLKDKEKLEELVNTLINVECSVILLNKVPEKLDDPGKFLIPCILQDLEVYNSLANSGASINLMPLSIYEKLGIGPLKPTRMTLELANRFVTFPMGIAEDVIVKVENFNFLIDFVIVDFEADPRVPIILGRPFLRTARALVGLYEEKLTLRVENEEVVFYTDKSSRNDSRNIHSIHCINIIDFSKDKTISGNPTPSNSVVESPSPSPIPYEDSDSLMEETDILISYFDDSSPEYETFSFDIEEKSSGSTTTHSDYSLPDYDAFYFDNDHIEEKSSGNTTTYSDFSLPKYDSFIFDLSIDPLPHADRSDFYHEEFVDELAHIISPPEYDYFYFDLEANPREFTSVLEKDLIDLSTKDYTSIDLNNNSPLLLYDCDSSLSKEFFEIDLLVSFPSGNEDISYPLFLTDSPEIDTLTSFPFENEDKVFDPEILTSKGFHSRYSLGLSHRDSKAFKINKKFKSPMEIFPFFFLYYGGDVSSIDVPYLHFYPP
ncbi:reverse transcriptase domain-containing protein [Tanacetum coccineum]